ncbi:hypothetical protein POTOM_041003 [Populus tomentosa]|uniref:Chalcone isomerase domain-containing protein n=1 Tax=Populus tomentosa TaxID=118781 RepID=A0A8X7Z1R6_POPTO|nr:hypothetical protein POTOM_041003 [Populus tomentosa]
MRPFALLTHCCSWESRIHRGNSNQREISEIIEFTGLLYLIIIAWNWSVTLVLRVQWKGLPLEAEDPLFFDDNGGTLRYREKVFAIIGVKVYAAGLYVNPSILSTLSTWKGQSASEIQENLALFSSIFQAPLEKSLQIVLVRDIDGKTFWDALDDAISPRIKTATPVDESALSTFRSIFQGRSLKKGTLIFLTWLNPSKMLVCVSSDGIPSSADATIESENVTSALFDVFFGDAPVSPSLKNSVANGLATILK